jgi:hypothetical protein
MAAAEAPDATTRLWRRQPLMARLPHTWSIAAPAVALKRNTAPPSAIALQNKAVAYDILLKTAAETIRLIGADPQHLGAETASTGSSTQR